MELSSSQLHILQHALGLDEYGQGEAYRRHFVACAVSPSWKDLKWLVSRGLMVRRRLTFLPDIDVTFMVTDLGERCAREQSPPPPKLTRGQRRYQRWLDSDSGMSFGDWLRGGY